MVSGGKRKNAGRKPGSGKYGETTKAIRVPKSLVDAVQAYVSNQGFRLPLYACKVSAGFPSPADDYLENKLDLNELLIKNPNTTFFVRSQGDSMIDAGISEGDILIVDRSVDVRSGAIIIAVLNGELTVKRFKKQSNGKTYLLPENPKYKAIEITEDIDFSTWGVVTNIIKKT